MPENDRDQPSENELDPGASTQVFQAFVDRHQQEADKTRRSWLPIAGAVVAVVVVAIVVWLLVG